MPCRFLQSLNAESLRRIFHKDLDAALLLDIITFFAAYLHIDKVESECATADEATRSACQVCLQTLEAMVSGPAFSYAKKMLSRSERDAGIKLMGAIKSMLSSTDASQLISCEIVITALSG
jgi:hypothetical protein